MHELAIMEGVIETISERAGDRRVATVRLEIGRLTGVVPNALRFCFEVCARGTILETASLEIAEIPGRAHCAHCGADRQIESFADFCPCGGINMQVIAGQELRLKNLELF
jgi:hydrogenase nickel incorporation protein HypA/HybF